MFYSFSDLAYDTLNKIDKLGSGLRSTREDFRRIFDKLKLVMEQSQVVFSKEIALEWVDDYLPSRSLNANTSKKLKEHLKRAIYLLDDNYNGKLTELKMYSSVFPARPKTKVFLSILQSYSDFLYKQDFTETTIYRKKHDASLLLIYLENNDIYSWKDVTHQIISDYFTSEHFQNRKPAGVIAEAYGVKAFIFFLEDKDMIESKTLHYAVPIMRAESRKIISVLSSEQKDGVISDFPDLPTNLRNKAASLLALKCGIRSCDLLKMTFEDINWNKKEITLIQEKTNIPLAVPMPIEVSNALIDYILHERRSTESDKIFIRSLGTATELKSRGSFNTGYRFARTNCLPPQQYGLHIMRRTFASDLLQSGASMDIISAALGHKDKQTVNKYLSTNEERMKLCALDISSFPYAGGYF